MKKSLLSILLVTSVCFVNAQTTYDVVVGPGLTYSPDVLTITEGDAVTFTSEGGSHDVNFGVNTLTGESFNNPAVVVSLPTQGAGLMGTITFDVAGTYNYDCSVYGHASGGMVGSITVNAAPSNTVVDIIVNSPDHTTLEAAVLAAELAETLSGDGPFTVFAPTDAAFAMLPEGILASLLADPTGALTSILLSHVASGNVLSTDLTDEMVITTLSGSEVSVSIDSSGVMINNAMVTVANLVADNGVVHVVNAVIISESDDCIDDDDAIAVAFSGGMEITNCSEAINYLINSYGYTTSEACAWDGMPMFNLGAETVGDLCECSCGDLETETNTVVDIIVNSPDHTTLETAVLAADLAGTLSGDGPFTVFAPTDAAFELIPADVMTSLLMDPMGSLTYVLTHHVHSGNVLSTDLSDGVMVPTVAGTELTVSISDLGVFIDGASVTEADIVADNGVIHVIDAVMVPADLDIEESLLSIDESEYLYSVDILGKRVAEDTRGMVIFDMYSSGKVIKRFKF
mgnify:CR=1 FL=1